MRTFPRVMLTACAGVVLVLALGWFGPVPADADDPPQSESVNLAEAVLTAPELLDVAGAEFSVSYEGPYDARKLFDNISDEDRLNNSVTKGMLEGVQGAIRQAYVREFQSSAIQRQVTIRTIELINNNWAAGFTKGSGSETLTAFPIGTRVRHFEGRTAGAAVIASLAKGRILLSVDVRTPTDDTGPTADGVLFEELDQITADVVTAQLGALPMTADLSDQRAFDLSDERILFGLALPTAMLVIALGYATAIGLRDRGTRERFTRRRRLAVPGAHVVDLSSAVSRSRRTSTFRSAVALMLLVAWVALCYFGTGRLRMLPTIGIFVAGVALVAVVTLWIKSRSQTGPGRITILAGSVGVTGAAMILAFVALLVALGTTGFVAFSGLFFWIPSIVFILIAVRAMSLTAKPIRFAKRLSTPSVTETLSRDKRREVILLRSFQDDDLEMRMHRSARHSALEFVSTESHERFEELIAWTLWRYGPVLAIGQPGTKLQPLGAAREYHSDATWQAAVEQRVANSAVIAFIVGRSPGLLWEVAKVRAMSALGKAVFIFPPEDAAELDRRLTVLAAALNLNPLVTPLNAGGAMPVVAMFFGHDGVPVFVTAKGRDDIAYHEVIDYVAGQVANRPRTLDGPAPHLRVADRDVRQLLASFDPSTTRRKRKRVLREVTDRLLDFV
ncbi:hypothetical protein ACIGKQ_22295 [Gordonia sp. NPDC062954]|uniref:hypothetical protein n=1 Tax=Gordonia sp. NPDC062954 TaxID=3364003 RepID=UPI0037C6DA06